MPSSRSNLPEDGTGASRVQKIANSGGLHLLVILFVVLIVAVVLFFLASPHFYFFKQVAPDEVGVQIRGGQVVNILPPGVYSDMALFASLETFSTSEVRFSVEDPEVLTSDSQRIGVSVSGSVFRPNAVNAEHVKALWTQYRSVLKNDEALNKVMTDLSRQAMKVCVGDRTFAQSAIGSSRDDLRTCVDTELQKLIASYGLTVSNIVVPNVLISDGVKTKLDQITQSRLDTDKALQDEKKAIAEGKANQAAQEATIRVEQSKAQEETRQKTTLAQLQQEQLAAEQKVIAAQKANDLLSAQKELEIAKAKALAAAEQAKADLAKEAALARLYQDNINYYYAIMAQYNASALKATDKVIIIPQGSVPNLILGNNVVPTIPISPTATPAVNP